MARGGSPAGHRARLVWGFGFVERQNLDGLYAGIKVVEGGVGRSAIAPEILYALWLYATLAGVGSAREVARLTQSHDAYRWICGGVQVNSHTLADFRSQEGEALDDLLTENIASLMAAGADLRTPPEIGSIRIPFRLLSCDLGKPVKGARILSCGTVKRCGLPASADLRNCCGCLKKLWPGWWNG